MIDFNPFLIAYLAIFALSSSVELLLEKVNRDYAVKHPRVPEPFAQHIDDEEFRKAVRYARDRARFAMIQTAAGKVMFLFVILSGLLPWIVQHLEPMHVVPAGLLFFAVPWLLTELANLPFDYYHSFVIEERYGFNTKTPKIWLADLIKSMAITLLIGAALLSALLLLGTYGGDFWWVWACGMFLGFQVLMTLLYPTLIAPLFNTFSPVEDSRLVERINRLVEREGFNVEGVFQMDAARRSRHTNAYFSGLGKTKRIVLFDTMLQSHTRDEIIGVVAHELGHYKKGHRWKQFIMLGVASAGFFFLASKMITWEPLFRAFGLDTMTLYAGFFLVGVLWEPAGVFLSPLGMALSRKFERQADLFAARALGTSHHLVCALKKMAKDNLANLRPHPLYVWFNYTHPPLLERVTSLEKGETN